MARGVRVGDGEDDDEIGDRALADEPLRPIDDVRVAVPRGRGPCGRRVRPRLGLGQGERDELLAAGELREPACLLVVAAGQRDREAAELLDGEDEPGRRTGAAQLLHGETDRQQLPAQAAVLGRERQGEDVVIGEEPAHVLGELAGPVDVGRARRDAVIGKDADRVSQHLLLVGQAERTLGSALGGHRLHRIARSGGAGRRTIGSGRG